MSPQADDLVAEYAAVICHGDSVPGQPRCGQVKISEAEYSRQMDRPDSLWMCPRCGSTATFDDEFYEKSLGIDQEEEAPPLEVELEALVSVHGTDAIRALLDKFEEAARHGG